MKPGPWTTVLHDADVTLRDALAAECRHKGIKHRTGTDVAGRAWIECRAVDVSQALALLPAANTRAEWIARRPIPQRGRYARRLDVFGGELTIIEAARIEATPTLFECIDLPDVTYGGTVEQDTIDGYRIERAETVAFAYEVS